MNGIMLIDGTEVPLACAEELAKNKVDIKILVAGPRVSILEAEKVARRFPIPPRIYTTDRPDKNVYIMSTLYRGDIDYIFSCFYEYRIRPALIGWAKNGGINIHPSYLPYNKGFHTSFWEIYDGTPMGATIHWLSENIDSGDIIGQIKIEDDGIMSAEEVRKKQREGCIKLFREYLPIILAGKAKHIPQLGNGSYHHKSDIIEATTIDSDISPDKLIRLCRATNFNDNGFYVKLNGRVFKISAHVSEVNE